MDSHSRSLIDRVRIASKDTFWRRLLMWGVVVLLASVSTKLLVPSHVQIPGQAILVSVLVLGSCAGLGASIYCFTRFALCKEFHYLIAAMGFSALECGSVAQAIIDLRNPKLSSFDGLGISAWLVSGLLFAFSSRFSQYKWKPGNRFSAIGQLVLAAVAVAAFPIIMSVYAWNTSSIYAYNSPTKGFSIYSIIEFAGAVLVQALFVISIIGHYKRFDLANDRMAGLMCYFFITLLPAVLFQSLSSTRYDVFWGLEQVLQVGAWLVLMAGVAIENAFSHKEAGDRLNELETLHQISWSLVGAGTVSELLDMFSFTLVKTLGAKIAAVYLADENEEHLELAAVCGPDGLHTVGTKYVVSSTDRRPGFHTGHTAKALTQKQLQIASDVFADVEFVPWRIIALDDGCAASLPLLDQDKAIGVLNLYFSDRKNLSSQRIKLLTTIAASATPAIEYASAREKDQNSSGKITKLDLAA